MTQPAEHTENRPLSQIFPYANNAREHSKKQVELLAKLMAKYGIDQPIVVDENGVILKGHGRRLAAIKLGLTHFPVVVHQGLSEADKRGLRIADNQSALISKWDPELIRLELQDLKVTEFDMNLFGFSEKELSLFTGEVKNPEPPQLDEMAFAVIIRCTGEDQQRELLERFAEEGLTAEAWIS